MWTKKMSRINFDSSLPYLFSNDYKFCSLKTWDSNLSHTNEKIAFCQQIYNDIMSVINLLSSYHVWYLSKFLSR